MWHQMGSSPSTSVKTYQGGLPVGSARSERSNQARSDPQRAGVIRLQRFASPYLVLGPDWTAQRDDDQDQRQNGTDGHHGPLSFGLD